MSGRRFLFYHFSAEMQRAIHNSVQVSEIWTESELHAIKTVNVLWLTNTSESGSGFQKNFNFLSQWNMKTTLTLWGHHHDSSLLRVSMATDTVLSRCNSALCFVHSSAFESSCRIVPEHGLLSHLEVSQPWFSWSLSSPMVDFPVYPKNLCS